MNILITGGAGFVGANLAKMFKAQHPGYQVVVFDNLKRRGSEFNLPEFKQKSILFRHGDLRNRQDLYDLEMNFDLVIDAAAEPSVTAGTHGSPDYVIDTNLGGTLNLLEFMRKKAKRLIFLSTSRVYSIESLRKIPMLAGENRFQHSVQSDTAGLTPYGINEHFDTSSFRSFYGSSKLCSEFMIQEYAAAYNFEYFINRCGVIAGAGQFGKVDQGVFTLWVINHVFGKPLKYTGFGGTGKQVRDILHTSDLFNLIQKQVTSTHNLNQVYNVGGGLECSVSMKEMTDVCQKIVGKSVTISKSPETNPFDIPYYITDNSKVKNHFDWSPKQGVEKIVTEISQWVKTNETLHQFLIE